MLIRPWDFRRFVLARKIGQRFSYGDKIWYERPEEVNHADDLACMFLSYGSRHFDYSVDTFRIGLVPSQSDDVVNPFGRILAEFALAKI